VLGRPPDQPGDDAVLGVLLGMPENPQGELVAGKLDRLDHVVIR
jgi:hypothetical protein